jgi:hypothetical protein
MIVASANCRRGLGAANILFPRGNNYPIVAPGRANCMTQKARAFSQPDS